VTEAEWLACGDPADLLEWLGDRASSRKARLFAVACFRHDWDAWTDPRQRRAIQTVERLADRMATEADRTSAEKALVSLTDELEGSGDLECIPHVPDTILRPDFSYWDAVCCVSQVGAKADYGPGSFDGCEAEVRFDLAASLRDIFGNPFRPAAFDPKWQNADVIGLARGIYEDRAFDRLPILADALMDAGCGSDDILAHCRSEGPHVRGCWVVDLVLGKEEATARTRVALWGNGRPDVF
jgi:hypothetical protein